MNKYGKAIPPKLIGKFELIIDMIEQVQDDHASEIDATMQNDLKGVSNLLFAHANTNSEYFNDN